MQASKDTSIEQSSMDTSTAQPSMNNAIEQASKDNVLVVRPIAVAHNGFRDKFGIPRQPREDSYIETRIVFEPPYRVREALRGIEDYSHLWLIWGFSACERQSADGAPSDWSPTVRPPRLGGNKRVGVFATRSPFRPNSLGLSSVRLLRIEESKADGQVLVVSGADLLDGTPIYDIKPYLSYSDSHPDARNGFGDATRDYRLSVTIDPELQQEAVRKGCPWQAIEEILGQDPRPAYQNDPLRVYHLDYADWAVSFSVRENCIRVEDITQCIMKNA
ncbi:MAG: tRNA (N6-threonylcarbamoyladenosine(37)-N6)-methyltransferase TrmO [Paludibacteraceae bacterium]|nr:tRNA (N6-threonylcarbamoyladenosine(37)-N6)-methyltransferase TrmO [Bacteroidales bacterium]MDY4149748.1 tRNA (N6-threonylcarbamoyladenosine(37)-N6)-methyltransferase TrmO [Paludibacteraceae bacterium]